MQGNFITITKFTTDTTAPWQLTRKQNKIFNLGPAMIFYF